MSNLMQAAKEMLWKIENMTSDEFSKGGERQQRDDLRAAIQEASNVPCPECCKLMIYQFTDDLGKDGHQDWYQCECGHGEYYPHQ